MKSTAKKVSKLKVIYLQEGTSIQNVIDWAKENGVTDLTKVRFDHDYVGCQGNHGDEYCYCNASYTDERFYIREEAK